MKQSILFFLIFLCGLFGSSWDYEKRGPSVWGTLNKEWRLCIQGKEQSPINIISQDTLLIKHALSINYTHQSKAILNNGHTVQIDFENSGSVSVGNKRFELNQLHFHTPSETHINGEVFPLEIHFVNQNKERKLLVISVLMKEGDLNLALEKILKAMPKKSGESHEFLDFDPKVLFPKEKAYYEFMGSLTTPPCSEGVIWIVLKDYVFASRKQIEAIHAVIRNNARPIQPRNHRKIKEAN